jgi:ABC-type nitrate/sulfonate/bicarbonate transport system substrate-binding protein
MALGRHNVDQKNIQWLPVGGSGPRYQALVSKRIDAGISQTNYAIRGEREAGLKVLADLGKELPDLMGYILTAKDSTITQKRSAMVKFVAAILETTRRVESDPDFAAKYYMTYQKQALLADVLKEHALLKASHAWGTEGTLRQDAIDFTAKMMQSEEKFKGTPKLDSLFDSSVFEDGDKLAASMK